MTRAQTIARFADGEKHGTVANFLRSANAPLSGCLTVGKALDQRDQLPDGGSAHQNIDDAGDSCILSSEERSDEVELEKADKSPIETADDDQKQRDDVDGAHGEDLPKEIRLPTTPPDVGCSATLRAQGFPEDYIIDRRPDGSPITATIQASCCGISVCPPLAKALVAANCADLAEFREAAE